MHLFSKITAACLLYGVVFGSAPGHNPGNAVVGHATSAVRPFAAPLSPISSAFTSFSANYASQAGNLRHWDKNEVTVRFCQNVGPERRKGSERGIDLWNERIGSIVHFTLNEEANADVTIVFVRPGSLPDGAIGLTQVAYRQEDQTLVRAVVRINDNLAGDALTQVVAHEIGHVLGIQGHSPDSHDLMYLHSHLPTDITPRDLNTVVLSYGASALGMSLDTSDGSEDTLSNR